MEKDKAAKYEELEREASKTSWTLNTMFIEVGARGWVPKTVFSALRTLGFLPTLAKALCDKLGYCIKKQLCSLVEIGITRIQELEVICSKHLRLVIFRCRRKKSYLFG